MTIKEKIISEYKPGITSLRDVAVICGTNHHLVKRVLMASGMAILRAKRRPFSPSHCAAISKSCKGRKTWSKGLKMNDDTKLKNLVSHIRFDVTYEWAGQFDLDILMTLNRMITPRQGRWRITTNEYMTLVERFSKDRRFLRIYEAWIASGREGYRAPSFDHITPSCRGGGCELSNIQVLTWFENRCKNHMTQQEWDKVKSDIGSYFL